MTKKKGKRLTLFLLESQTFFFSFFFRLQSQEVQYFRTIPEHSKDQTDSEEKEESRDKTEHKSDRDSYYSVISNSSGKQSFPIGGNDGLDISNTNSHAGTENDSLDPQLKQSTQKLKDLKEQSALFAEQHDVDPQYSQHSDIQSSKSRQSVSQHSTSHSKGSKGSKDSEDPHDTLVPAILPDSRSLGSIHPITSKSHLAWSHSGQSFSTHSDGQNSLPMTDALHTSTTKQTQRYWSNQLFLSFHFHFFFQKKWFCFVVLRCYPFFSNIFLLLHTFFFFFCLSALVRQMQQVTPRNQVHRTKKQKAKHPQHENVNQTGKLHLPTTQTKTNQQSQAGM